MAGAIRLGAFGIRQRTRILGIAVSPDGTRVATGDDEGRVRVFDAATSECVLEVACRRVSETRGSISRLAFSPAG
ncbi:MAG TPA: hypothetical protein VHZ95_16335, partial [Polyangiales bacterium]|nr:hypothetical protein [Polyangiales bacterium]